jgi:hypothetical protein
VIGPGEDLGQGVQATQLEGELEHVRQVELSCQRVHYLQIFES